MVAASRKCRLTRQTSSFKPTTRILASNGLRIEIRDGAAEPSAFDNEVAWLAADGSRPRS
jgi:hypothetical protein